MKDQKRFWIILSSVLLILIGALETSGAQSPCCAEDPELSYLLSPKPSQRFQYLVRYEIFYSTLLNKKKGFFIILPEDFFQNPSAKYPLLFLLHGYNFQRTGLWWKVHSPEKAKRLLCEVKEEEYHWLLHEDIAVIAYGMMDSKNRTYRDLEKSLELRFQELSQHGGLAKKDYSAKEIAQSIAPNNLYPQRG